MLGRIFQPSKGVAPHIATSKLLDQDTFYPSFLKDINQCRNELLIESPFMTTRRLNQLVPILQKLRARHVRIIINTRDPQASEDERWMADSTDAISRLQDLGVQVLYTGGHHRKLVIVDRAILYEGSLNVLSQNDSCEVMRRIESVPLAWEMVRFVGVDKYAL